MARRGEKSHIGLILRNLRQGRGWDQAALAAASGVSQAHISAIEIGRYRSPKADTLARLASALGVSISVFFPDLGKAEGVAESMAYWEARGLPTPEEEEFLGLLRDPEVGPELRRLARLLRRVKRGEGAREPRRRKGGP